MKKLQRVRGRGGGEGGGFRRRRHETSCHGRMDRYRGSCPRILRSNPVADSCSRPHVDKRSFRMCAASTHALLVFLIGGKARLSVPKVERKSSKEYSLVNPFPFALFLFEARCIIVD